MGFVLVTAAAALGAAVRVSLEAALPTLERRVRFGGCGRRAGGSMWCPFPGLRLPVQCPLPDKHQALTAHVASDWNVPAPSTARTGSPQVTLRQLTVSLLLTPPG